VHLRQADAYHWWRQLLPDGQVTAEPVAVGRKDGRRARGIGRPARADLGKCT
jgi:hypothetical protein